MLTQESATKLTIHVDVESDGEEYPELVDDSEDECEGKPHPKQPSKAGGNPSDAKYADVIMTSAFGHLITAAHAILGSKDDMSRHGGMTAVVMQDEETWMFAIYPHATKSTDDTVASCQQFVGPKDSVKRFYTDNSRNWLLRQKSFIGGTTLRRRTGRRQMASQKQLWTEQ